MTEYNKFDTHKYDKKVLIGKPQTHINETTPAANAKPVDINKTFGYRNPLSKANDQPVTTQKRKDGVMKSIQSPNQTRLKIYVDIAETWHIYAKAFKSAAAKRHMHKLLHFVPSTQAQQSDLHLTIIPPRKNVSPNDLLPHLQEPINNPKWAVFQDGHLVMPLHNLDGRCTTSQVIDGGCLKSENTTLHGKNGEDVIRLLLDNLEKIALHHRISQLKNSNPASLLNGQFELILLRCDDQGEWVEAMSDSNNHKVVFAEGERMALKLINNSGRRVFINLLNLGMDKSITHIYPPHNTKGIEMIPESKFELTGRNSLGYSVVFPIDFRHLQTLSEADVSAKEAGFVLLVTETQTDVAHLLQDTITRNVSPASALEQIFKLVHKGTAETHLTAAQPQSAEDWTTVSQTYFVRPRPNGSDEDHSPTGDEDRGGDGHRVRD